MKFLFLTLVIISNANAGLFSKKISFPQRAHIEVLISEGRFDEALSSLDGAEIDDFWSNKLLDKISNQKKISNLGYASDHKPVCEEKIAELLFKANVKPSEHAIFNYVVAPCPDLAKKVIEIADKKALIASSKLIADFVGSVTVEQNKLASEKLEPNEERDLGLLQQLIPSLKSLEEKIKSNGDNADDIHTLAESINKIADSRKFFASKEGQDSLAMSSVCSLYRKKNELEASIQEEKQKGKVSGYVNAYKLKTWGDELYDTVGQLNSALDNYRNITKKKFSNFKGCE